MDILSKIFSSEARVKIMRLFLMNLGKFFTRKEIAEKSRVNRNIVNKEIKLLSSISFLRKRDDSWSFNPSFRYGEEISHLLLNSDTLDKRNMGEAFKKTGRIKLLLISGVFIKNSDSKVDLLVVGDKMKKKKIEEEIKKLEASLGKEITYAIFETEEFMYRLNMYDKLVRDILDFPHERILQGKEFYFLKNSPKM